MLRSYLSLTGTKVDRPGRRNGVTLTTVAPRCTEYSVLLQGYVVLVCTNTT